MKKITFMRFKDNLSMPGVAGDIGKTLPSQSKTIPDLAMFSTPACYLVRIGGREIEISRDMVMYAEVHADDRETSDKTGNTSTKQGASQGVAPTTITMKTKAS